MNIAGSAERKDQHAPLPEATAIVTPTTPRRLAPSSPRRKFAPTLWPTIAAALLIALFSAAGHWQWSKAEAKKARQAADEARADEAPLAFPTAVISSDEVDAWRDRRVRARGRYDATHTILLDNRTHEGRAGYHVLTPLLIDGSEARVLVNRGWLPLPADRSVPAIETPNGTIVVEGFARLPSRYFALGGEAPADGWRVVWQHLDLARYETAAGFPVQPLVVELDADQDGAGGFLRAWPRPDARVTTNVAYALQWWAFAATTAALWLFFSFRRGAP